MSEIKPTLEQLKSAAYDCMARIEQEQRNLKMINQAILAEAKRIKNVEEPITTEPSGDKDPGEGDLPEAKQD